MAEQRLKSEQAAGGVTSAQKGAAQAVQQPSPSTFGAAAQAVQQPSLSTFAAAAQDVQRPDPVTLDDLGVVQASPPPAASSSATSLLSPAPASPALQMLNYAGIQGLNQDFEARATQTLNSIFGILSPIHDFGNFGGFVVSPTTNAADAITYLQSLKADNTDHVTALNFLKERYNINQQLPRDFDLVRQAIFQKWVKWSGWAKTIALMEAAAGRDGRLEALNALRDGLWHQAVQKYRDEQIESSAYQ